MNIDGQLSAGERQLLTDAVLRPSRKPQVVLEVGTWLGGGSTLHILRALHQNNEGHLWGIEADQSIYERMIKNIGLAAPDALSRFTALFGKSQKVIPKWLAEQDQNPDFQIDLVFLDGGNNPLEQITEFELLKDRIPVGGVLMAHDARVRKGKWFVPYISRLDNWHCELHDSSEVGLLVGRKLKSEPSAESSACARSHLFRLRLQPAEVAAAILPKRLCGLVLQLLPRRYAASLAHGVPSKLVNPVTENRS